MKLESFLRCLTLISISHLKLHLKPGPWINRDHPSSKYLSTGLHSGATAHYPPLIWHVDTSCRTLKNQLGLKKSFSHELWSQAFGFRPLENKWPAVGSNIFLTFRTLEDGSAEGVATSRGDETWRENPVGNWSEYDLLIYYRVIKEGPTSH